MKLSDHQARVLEAAIEMYTASGEKEVHTTACELRFNKHADGYRWRAIRLKTWLFLETSGLVIIRRRKESEGYLRRSDFYITPTQSARAALSAKAG